MNKLAKITSDRFIAREDSRVHLLWDDINLQLTRTQLVRLRHTMERGLDTDFVEDDDLCSIVHLDEEHVELWIKDTCLQLTWRDYAKLLNALLTSETRLHGIRMAEDEWQVYAGSSQRQSGPEIQPIMTIRPPKRIRHARN